MMTPQKNFFSRIYVCSPSLKEKTVQQALEKDTNTKPVITTITDENKNGLLHKLFYSLFWISSISRLRSSACRNCRITSDSKSLKFV